MEKKGKTQAMLGMLALVALILVLLILFMILKNDALNNYFANRAMENKGIAASLPSEIMEEEAEKYYISEERVIGKYVYRLWEQDSVIAAAEGEYPRMYVTLSLKSEPAINIVEIWGLPVEIISHSGKDITGEGNPDLVVQRHTGGAHCCFQYYVFDLGDTAVSKHLESQPSNCFGEFKDLDDDGVYEIFTCDDFFTYEHCSSAEAPRAPLVLKFVPGWGYLPATPNFKDLEQIRMRIVTDVAETEHGLSKEHHEKDREAIVSDVLCPALQVALDYLYIGEAGAAESEFRRLYKYSDVSDIWWYLTNQVYKSRLFTPDELKVHVYSER